MEQFCIQQILYLKARNSQLAQGEVPAAIEYAGPHGPATFFITAALSPQLQQLAQQQGGACCLKLLQLAENEWQVMVHGSQPGQALTFQLAANQLQALLQKHGIQLPRCE